VIVAIVRPLSIAVADVSALAPSTRAMAMRHLTGKTDDGPLEQHDVFRWISNTRYPSRAPAAQPRNRPISPLERRRLAGGVPLAPVLREGSDRAACRLDTPQLTARP